MFDASTNSSPSKDSVSSSSTRHPSTSPHPGNISLPSMSKPIFSKLPKEQHPVAINEPSHAQIVPIAEPQDNTKTPVYTHRLIPKKYISLAEVDEDFDEDACLKRLYGPDIIISLGPETFLKDGFRQTVFVPFLRLLIVDPNLPPKKEKKLWDEYDVTDPNWEFNDIRVGRREHPIDR